MKTYCPHNPPAHTSDVANIQKALGKFYHGKIDGIYSALTVSAVKRAKYQLGFPMSQVNAGCAGDRLYSYLTGQKQLPLKYRLLRRKRGYGLSKWTKVRNSIVNWATYGVEHEPQIHYGQRRPIPHKMSLPLTTDCSGFVTLCYELAGAPDPNGNHYNGQGWTGTLLAHGEHIALHDAEPGDLVVWGVYPGHHVAVISDVSNRSDPDLVSHGAERGPLRVKLSVESRAQNRPYTVLRFIPAK